MPKEELKIELIKECKAEIKFIQSHGNVNASSQPIYKPSSIATQFLAMNDIKPLKKVGLFLLLLLWILEICNFFDGYSESVWYQSKSHSALLHNSHNKWMTLNHWKK